MRLLLVEDDRMLGSSLKKGLGFEQYSVEWVQTGAAAADCIQTMDFDVVVLDINLPDCSGIDVLRKIRQGEKTKLWPVLLLTAISYIEQKITGLDNGADDYLTKPFDFKELTARLRAIVRRGDGHADNILRARDIELDLNTKQIRRGDICYLPTAHELKLMILLMKRPGKLIGKSRIEEEFYGWEGDVESNTVEVTVYNLRKKLGKDVITTMRGVGYMVPQ